MPKKLLINSPIAEAKTPAAVKADHEKNGKKSQKLSPDQPKKKNDERGHKLAEESDEERPKGPIERNSDTIKVADRKKGHSDFPCNQFSPYLKKDLTRFLQRFRVERSTFLCAK